MSLSARRAWIETTPPKECSNPGGVALRKESVDRNALPPDKPQLPQVALRKESVDRNQNLRDHRQCREMSLSARRAWIETSCLAVKVKTYGVALRKESVDRNSELWASVKLAIVALRKESVDRNIPVGVYKISAPVSLSARRAWIETARE